MTEAYRDRWRRYEAMWGSSVPGFNVKPALRHHEADGLIRPTGDGAYSITFCRRYLAPIETVWAALTEPARLADWFAQAEVDLRVGGAINFDWRAHGHVERNVILELEPPKLLVWGSRERETPGSTVRWELYEEDAAMMGTRVMLTQTLIPPRHLLSIAPGWHIHLDELPDAAVRATPRAWTLQRERARAERELEWLVPRYRQRLPADAVGAD